MSSSIIEINLSLDIIIPSLRVNSRRMIFSLVFLFPNILISSIIIFDDWFNFILLIEIVSDFAKSLLKLMNIVRSNKDRIIIKNWNVKKHKQTIW